MSLELLKARFGAMTDALLIRGDDLGQRVLVAWPRYAAHKPRFVDSAFKPNETESAALARFWGQIGPVDFVMLGGIAGLPETKAEKTFSRMKSALLLWPDGTISGHIQQVLMFETQTYLRGLGWEPKVKPAPPQGVHTETINARPGNPAQDQKPARPHRNAKDIRKKGRS